jgi:hypothetical protein
MSGVDDVATVGYQVGQRDAGVGGSGEHVTHPRWAFTVVAWTATGSGGIATT